LSERILDRELSVDGLAVLKIFGTEDRAPGFERSGDRQSVVDSEAVLLRDLKRRFMGSNGDGERQGAQDAKRTGGMRAPGANATIQEA
jgi:hypothetical protein